MDSSEALMSPRSLDKGNVRNSYLEVQNSPEALLLLK